MADDALFEPLAPAGRTAIVNIGASDVGDIEIYQQLLDLDIGTMVGFEPLPEQFEILKAKQDKKRFHFTVCGWRWRRAHDACVRILAEVQPIEARSSTATATSSL